MKAHVPSGLPDGYPFEKPILLHGGEYGVDLYLEEETLEEIRRRAAGAGVESVETFYGDEVNWEDLAEELATGDLFGDRLVVVRHADSIRDDRGGTVQEQLLGSPPAGAQLVFLIPGRPDRRLKSTRLFEAHCLGIACPLPEPWELSGWIVRFLKQRGYRISRSAAEIAATLLENDPMHVAHELEKLILFLGDRKTAEEADVEECLSFSREDKPWAVPDHLLGGRVDKALMSAGRIREPMVVLSLFSRQMKKAYEVACLREMGLRDSAILSRLKAVVARTTPRDAQADYGYSKKKLARVLTEVVRTEALLKSAPVEKGLLIDLLLFRVHRILRAPDDHPRSGAPIRSVRRR